MNSVISYSSKDKSVPQKIFLIALEILIIWFSYKILLNNWGDFLFEKYSWNTQGNPLRRKIIFAFNIALFLTYLPTILIFVKRKITWTEAFNIPLAFGTYYVGFALLAYGQKQPLNLIDYLGIFIFILGLGIHFMSEYQRFIFKQNPQNQNKLLTDGLWAYSRHINFFADLIWVSGYALVSRNWYSILVVILLFVFFYFFNIPQQEKYLQQKYGQQFENYKKQTKSLIPFIL